jgi:hypothetical protein
MHVLKSDIKKDEFKPYYDLYLSRVSEDTELFEALEQKDELIHFFEALPEHLHEFRYATGKWTPKQILQHLIDTERIFVNRALRFAREDYTELPGYDENHYADHCNSNQRTIQELLREFNIVRSSSILLYQSFSETAFTNIGQASGGPFSVRAIPFILCGHQRHHLNIIQQRYLNQ